MNIKTTTLAFNCKQFTEYERWMCKKFVSLRGAIKIENRENLGQCPNPEMSQFQFGNFEN